MLRIKEYTGAFSLLADETKWFECFRERTVVKILLSLDVLQGDKHILAYGCSDEDQKKLFKSKLGVEEDFLFPVFIKITGTKQELAKTLKKYFDKLKFKPVAIPHENGLLLLAVCETEEEAENAKKGIL